MVIIVNRHLYKGQGTYIGRRTPFDNQASHIAHPGVRVLVDTREQAVSWYKTWLWDRIKEKGEVYNELLKLAQKVKKGEEIVLICSCKPHSCHGDILKAAIEWLARTSGTALENNRPG